jgi:hypothetical protein
MASQSSASNGLTIFSAPFSVAPTIRRSSCSRAAQLGVAQCLGPSGLIPRRNAHIVPIWLSWDGGCIIHSASTRTDGINYFTLVRRRSLVGLGAAVHS